MLMPTWDRKAVQQAMARVVVLFKGASSFLNAKFQAQSYKLLVYLSLA